MRGLDLICALGVAALVWAHHALTTGAGARFELHPAVVVLLIFFAIYGAYRMVFGKGADRK
ncbi:MAG: hypothetical protein GF334_12860 [Candidatus Altiarchaeales archaeon]|nr:hypothetical protein [Candidatus Altiarchaeales archaeon]